MGKLGSGHWRHLIKNRISDNSYRIAGNFHQGKFSPNLACTSAENFRQIYFRAHTFITYRHARAVTLTTTKMRKATQQDQGALHYAVAESSYSVAKS